jgi:hypothetical protein
LLATLSPRCHPIARLNKDKLALLIFNPNRKSFDKVLLTDSSLAKQEPSDFSSSLNRHESEAEFRVVMKSFRVVGVCNKKERCADTPK